jgi:uncharacterized membrane protein
MKAVTGLTLVLFVVLLLLLPLMFGQLMVAALAKLHLGPMAALLVMIGIIVGSVINIPVHRIVHEKVVSHHPLALFGLSDLWPDLRRSGSQTIIAVNVGGCLIPTGLAVYELAYLMASDPLALVHVAIACAVSIVACYFLASPVPGVGVLIPGLIPPAIAATLAVILAPEQAPPVAFIAGVAGPLVGADLLHLKEIRGAAAGVASIGGAGTFDGIVLSGIVAAYLA